MEIKKLDKTSETRQGGNTIIWQHYQVLLDPESHSAMMTGSRVAGEFRATIMDFNRIVFEVKEEG